MRYLIERRVPHIVAIYAGVSWAVVEFTDFAVDEFLLSPYWTRLILATLLLMLPTVVMLAWFHGKPGKDRDSLARTERIGIPANVVLCAIALWVLFGGGDPDSATAGEDPDSTTTQVTVETEQGLTVERKVPKPEFLKSTALFPLSLGPGMGEDESWISYAVLEALKFDLMADDFFVPYTFFGFESYARERGFESFGKAPLALKRELARERYAGFMATGEIDRADGLYRLTLRVSRVDDGSLAGEATRQGTDLLALVDSVSGPVKTALGIPVREGIEDLPVRGRLSENGEAVEAFFRGIYARFAERGTETAVEYLTTATTLDPTFTVAQYVLSELLEISGEHETVATIAPLLAAMDHLYRMPERYGFRVKADYYRLTKQMDLAAAVVEMWVDLYPNDLNALRARMNWQRSSGDGESVLATLAAMRDLDPLDGGLLLEMAATHEELGNDDQALAARTEYVERFPGDAFGYAGLAWHHRRRAQHGKAREQLERAIVLEPLDSEFVIHLAEIDLDVGRVDEAGAEYVRGLDLARAAWDTVWVLRGLRDYHHRRGEMADAFRAIEARLEVESGYRSPIGIVLGRLADIPVYLDAGRVGEAAALLEELRAQIPPGQSGYLPHVTVRVALEAEGVDAALEAHRKAMEVVEENDVGGPDRAVLAGDLGMIRERAGNYAGAAESFREAIALSPEARYYRGAGRALRKAGRLDEAEAELREALRLVPADPHAHVEMALLLEARGETEGAVEHLRSALRVWENADRDYAPALEARAKLAELDG